MQTDVKQEPRSDNMPELDDSETSTDAAASASNVKNEPKDPLAQAMDELTGGNKDDADKSNDDMDGASALAALASAAATAENSTENGKKGNSSVSTNGTSSSNPQESKRDANWFDVGIIKGSSCTVSSYYLPSGDGERPEIDVEGMYCSARCYKIAKSVKNS